MQIFFVEGNIGTGKSTFLSLIEKFYSDTCQVIYEPVNLWTTFTDSTGTNILDYFYKDMNRYAYAFQNLAFISRVEKITEIDQTKKFVFIERSIWSDCNVFAQNCHEQGMLSEIEFLLYKRWFDWVSKMVVLPCAHQHVYLKCDPNISFDRMKIRNRKEEATVPLDYIRQIHNQHERWLSERDDIITIDASIDFTNEHVFRPIFENLCK